MFLSPFFDEGCLKVSVLHKLTKEDQVQRGTFKSLALVVPWNIQDQAATYIAACGGFSNGDFKFRSDLYTFECTDEVYDKWGAALKERQEFETFMHYLSELNIKTVSEKDKKSDDNDDLVTEFYKNAKILGEEVSALQAKLMQEDDLSLIESTHKIFDKYKEDYKDLYQDFLKLKQPDAFKS